MRGRPAFEITPEVLEKVERLASQGMTQEQIADCLDISVSTLCKKKNDYAEFSEAIKRGSAKGIDFVTNALLENVQDMNVSAQIFYLKCKAKWREDAAHLKELQDRIDRLEKGESANGKGNSDAIETEN